MDPDAALKRIREIANRILAINDGDVDEVASDELAEDGVELAETVLGLADWIAKGGFLPGEWVRA